MRYTNPRFRSMSPFYQTTPDVRSGATPFGTEGVVHPGFESQGETSFGVQNTPAVEGYLPFQSQIQSPFQMANPAFQQGWNQPTYGQTLGNLSPVWATQQPNLGPIATPGYLSPFQSLQTPWTSQATQPWTSQASQPWTQSQTIGWPSQTGMVQGYPLEEGIRPRVLRQPACDVFDAGENLILEIELPGVAKEDVDLVCNDTSVSLKAKATERHEEENLVQSERGQVLYQRSIPLGVTIVPGDIEATFEDGVLTITAPKKEPTSGLHKVEIE